MTPMPQNEPSITLVEKTFEEHARPCTKNANDALQERDPLNGITSNSPHPDR